MSSCKIVILEPQIQQVSFGFLSKAVAETKREFTTAICANSPTKWPNTPTALPAHPTTKAETAHEALLKNTKLAYLTQPCSLCPKPNRKRASKTEF